MNLNIRDKFILDTLDKHGDITVNIIVKRFNISGMTARRDIANLAQQGFLLRTHGGAIKNDPLSNMFSFSRRIDRYKERKITIGLRAAQYVRDNDTIYIDSGTTLIRMCQFLKNKKGLKIITNSLPAASELTNHSDMEIILIGGKIIPERRAIYGHVAVKQAADYHVQKAFIGTDGISLKNGLSAYDNNECNVSKTITNSADQVLLLCDSSKIEKESFYIFAPLSIIDTIITDNGIDTNIADNYKEKDINIIIA
jgi:DeoR family fructose operon transcriptional repressor